jgi:RNA polymerase sigma-70 factor (ECF subfamily)
MTKRNLPGCCAPQSRATKEPTASSCGALPASFAEPETEAVSNREIGRVLDVLTPGQRSVVASISVDGNSISETAKNLGMSETAVRVSLHRGLAAIAKRFGRD